MRPLTRRLHARLGPDEHDRGSAVLEFVIIGPALVALLLFVVFLGRSVTSSHAVQDAARAAARAASLTISPDVATSEARSAAADALNQQGIRCLDISVAITQSGTAAVTATVRCSMNLGDLALPTSGLLQLPATKTFTATFTSPIDPNRDRGNGALS